MGAFFVKEQTIHKYAHLEYEVLHKLEVSIAEYWYLDMVYQLSRDGWCYKSLDNTAKDMRITKNGVVKMRDRLIKRGLVKKNIKGYVKTTVMYNSVYRLDKKAYNSVTNRTTRYNAAVQLSGTKNNNEIKKERDFNKNDHRGEFSPVKEMLRAKWSRKAGGQS